MLEVLKKKHIWPQGYNKFHTMTINQRKQFVVLDSLNLLWWNSNTLSFKLSFQLKI